LGTLSAALLYSVSVCVLFFSLRRPLRSTLFPYTTLFRSLFGSGGLVFSGETEATAVDRPSSTRMQYELGLTHHDELYEEFDDDRSEEHTSELQSRENLVCRLLLEKKKTTQSNYYKENSVR